MVYKIFLPNITLIICTFLIPNAFADNHFNPAFLSDDPSMVADLSRFEGRGQAAGIYRVDVYINNTYVSTSDINFITIDDIGNSDETGLHPCFTSAFLDNAGVDIQKIINIEAEQCIDITKHIEGATSLFEFETLKLDLKIPQASMVSSAKGYISPALWDEGINALLLNYTFNGSSSSSKSDDNTSSKYYFLGVDAGINIGSWYFRDYATWSYSDGVNYLQHINTYVEHAIVPLKGSLIIGDTYTSSDIFDSVPVRGIQLRSDDNMLPDSLRGFAPVVRGIARSDAKVTIKQNGYTLYQGTVPPGAFEINDLYSTSSSGDLTVSIEESDGSIHSFDVPYSAVPILQREGRLKYSSSVGTYRQVGSDKEEPSFFQGNLIYGLPLGFTIYGGSQLSNKYQAYALGGGVNMGGYGAISFDFTHASSVLVDSSKHKGQSVRFLYAKSMNEFGSNIQLLGYRYSTKGYYTFSDTTYKKMSGYELETQDGSVDKEYELSDYFNLYYTKRGKIQINISQDLNDYGSLFITGSRQSYWNTDEVQTLYQVGYNGSFSGVTYGVNFSYNKSPGMSDVDKIVSLNLSLPIADWLQSKKIEQKNNIYATANSSMDAEGHSELSAGISGTLLEDNNLDYSVRQGFRNEGRGANGSVGVKYNGSFSQLNLGYIYSDNGDYNQVNFGASGGVAIHSGGITFGQPLGDTNILISAPGAEGVSVEGFHGVKTDRNGYAIVPYATSYKRNRVALNTNSLPDNAEIENVVSMVVPIKRSLVKAEFDVHVGYKAMFSLKHGGKFIPFGAIVSAKDDTAKGTSIVGDEGVVYLSGLKDSGSLLVQWGRSSEQRCTVNYNLPRNSTDSSLVQLNEECV